MIDFSENTEVAARGKLTVKLGYSLCEDTCTLRLASELADLRVEYANLIIQSLPLGV